MKPVSGIVSNTKLDTVFDEDGVFEERLKWKTEARQRSLSTKPKTV
jgi:hypothetical protein